MDRRLIYLMLMIFGLVYMIQACNRPFANQDSEETIPDSISYNFHVRPILSDKCFACHGPDANKRDADLRLDIQEDAYKALKDNPAAHGIVPFKPSNSEVFLRISSTDTSYMMPPISSNLKLTPTEIGIIEKWIKQGAKYEKHWAFTPAKTPVLPQVKDSKWVKNEIDYFVLDKLEHKGIVPNPEADKERLLKRASLDITGLPPSLEMMEKFMADTSPNAYEKVVESLLASPAYGERMALHWMDVSRYADSHGYQDDNYRSQWPWRDWVIHAFNNNTSYDKFITWQLAGDLMPNASKEQLLATAFNRNHKITEEGGVIDEEYRVEYVRDRTNTLGKAILGITLECAQCHDHKYDPFSQKEYFQMTAFFNNVKEVGLESTVGGPETYAKKPFMEISNADIKDILNFVNKQDTNKLIVSVMGDQDTLRKTYVLNRGEYDAHGEVVEASTPKSVLPFSDTYQKNRLGLTQWLFDKKNPLTSRVFVNQIWQEYFGRGLVKTSGDFGMQGELPSHPELLDWLAVDFMNHGWNIKRLVKQLVLSATYRQSAIVSPEKYNTDPENIFLARAPRYRIPAEHVRDVVLSSSGLLVRTIGGPSVKPYQPAGLWEAATSGRGILASYSQDHQSNLYRRGLYTFIKRTVPPAVMAIFDASNRDQCEVKRLNTNTPLQALAMLNDPTVLEASRVLADKLLQEQGTAEIKITKAFRRIVCRKPKEQELKQLTAYYTDQLTVFKEKSNANKVLAVGEFPISPKVNKTQLAALMGVITVIYNLEETITKS
ncbi:PSD1 and planctomycete cytochrome C domain-containing protein [Sphingobacterium sp. SG20118]|uniref:PSD1 and planctomycete cytochrome C domain-containing protein n=1 Tax=Sphingobacterium sp. SG20118 TaxID=3367156 RepID=UPI0037DFC762